MDDIIIPVPVLVSVVTHLISYGLGFMLGYLVFSASRR